MADQRVLQIWRRVGGGTVPTVKLKPDSSNTPTGGDICIKVAGLLQYSPTSTGTVAERIDAICVEGISELDIMNKPGYTAASSSAPGIAAFGGRGSRELDTTGKRKMFVPVTSDLQWVMTVKAGATVAVGSQYGYTRVAAGDYTVGGTATAALSLEVMGLYSPDVDAALTLATTPIARVWVRAVNPGQGL